jgi:2-iminobutanoate/2-iminopropanoate deaminase
MKKWLIAIISLALVLGCSQQALVRKTIQTDRAPAAIGPYSQAVQVGPTLYLAGQLGMDPGTGKLVEGGIQAQTTRAMENLAAVLTAAGFTFDDVVATQAFLADMNDFAAFNKIYATYFKNNLPARAVVQPARLPRDGMVEIMMTAVKSKKP